MKLELIVAGVRTGAELYTNPVAGELAKMLPLELAFSDFNGVEKVASLDRALTLSGVSRAEEPHAGEIGYYAPTRNLVLYYDTPGRWTDLVRRAVSIIRSTRCAPSRMAHAFVSKSSQTDRPATSTAPRRAGLSAHRPQNCSLPPGRVTEPVETATFPTPPSRPRLVTGCGGSLVLFAQQDGQWEEVQCAERGADDDRSGDAKCGFECDGGDRGAHRCAEIERGGRHR